MLQPIETRGAASLPCAVKVCRGACGKTLPLESFCISKREKDGRKYQCRECQKTQADGWHARNPEKKREYRKAWRERAPEELRALDRKYNLSRYRITPEKYDRMVAEQNGVCALCGFPPMGRGKKLHVDHVHDESRKVRKLLCTRCNVAIGLMREDPALFRKAAEYLDSHADKPAWLGRVVLHSPYQLEQIAATAAKDLK